jgi:CRISPR/Cas system-associated protein Cas10 (large subunit of type III CRISPR-Cas system)
MLFNCCDVCGNLFALKHASSRSRNHHEAITELSYYCPVCSTLVKILRRESQEEYEKNPFM